jgi:hypothetical protein
MRQRFEQQLCIGVTAISEVKLSLKSRDELAPILMGLQHVFNTPALSEKVWSNGQKEWFFLAHLC